MIRKVKCQWPSWPFHDLTYDWGMSVPFSTVRSKTHNQLRRTWKASSICSKFRDEDAHSTCTNDKMQQTRTPIRNDVFLLLADLWSNMMRKSLPSLFLSWRGGELALASSSCSVYDDVLRSSRCSHATTWSITCYEKPRASNVFGFSCTVSTNVLTCQSLRRTELGYVNDLLWGRISSSAASLKSFKNDYSPPS